MARDAAGHAAVDAGVAAEAAQNVATSPPPMPASTPQLLASPLMTPAPPGSVTIDAASGPVTVTSHPGHSISGDYRIDFDAMDGDRDGAISRTEVGGNGSLAAEFHVVDANQDGRLTREELKGWLR